MSTSESLYNRISLKEFTVDFLGGLVPGMFFIVLAAMSISGPVYLFIGVIGLDLQNLFSTGKQVFESLHIEISIFLIISSYIVGHFFLRNSPKKPDEKSYKNVSKKFSRSEHSNWVINKFGNIHKDLIYNENDKQCKKNKDAKICMDKKDKGICSQKGIKCCKNRRKRNIFTKIVFIIQKFLRIKDDHRDKVEYPYSNLKNYLEHRGHKSLKDKIKWNPTSLGERSKTLINMFKAEIFFHFPDKCKLIIRNEAHIRMMSSMWYACRTIFALCFSCILIMLGEIIFIKSNNFPIETAGMQNTLPGFLILGAVLIISIIMKSGIENFIHYQRVREIVYVLKTHELLEETLKKRKKK